MANKKRPTSLYEDPVEYSAGQYNAVTPSLSDGDCLAFQFDSAGNLLTKQVNAGSGSNPAAGATAAAVPADADYVGFNSGGNLVGVSSSNPLPVTETKSTSPAVGQAKVAVTGTAVQLGSNALNNGVIITAKSTNAAPISLGGSGVNNTVDGTGNGYILEAGASASFAVDNSNRVYINGTAGDIVSFAGS